MNKFFDIILATHSEDLRWTSYLPKDRPYRLVVSNSNGIAKPEAADELVLRENFGREAGHYLNYLIEKYDELPEVMVFMQGDPWPHAAVYGNPCIMLEILFGTPKFRYPICYLGRNYSIELFKPAPESEHHRVLSRAYAGSGYGSNIPISIGAQFYVRREVVLAHPKDFYQRLLEVGRDQTLYHADPYYTLAHTLEGCWGSVFRHDTESVI